VRERNSAEGQTRGEERKGKGQEEREKERSTAIRQKSNQAFRKGSIRHAWFALWLPFMVCVGFDLSSV